MLMIVCACVAKLKRNKDALLSSSDLFPVIYCFGCLVFVGGVTFETLWMFAFGELIVPGLVLGMEGGIITSRELCLKWLLKRLMIVVVTEIY